MDLDRSNKLTLIEFDEMKRIFRSQIDIADHTKIRRNTFIVNKYFSSEKSEKTMSLNQWLELSGKFQNMVFRLEYAQLAKRNFQNRFFFSQHNFPGKFLKISLSKAHLSMAYRVKILQKLSSIQWI